MWPKIWSVAIKNQCESIQLAGYLKNSYSDEWLAADVLEFVVGNPQTQEHPRISQEENTQAGSWRLIVFV